MQFKEQAKAIWNANQEKVTSSLGPSDFQQQPSFDKMSSVQNQDQIAAASFFLDEGLR